MPDLYTAASVSGQLLNSIQTALNRMRTVVVQAGSGTLTYNEKVMLQGEVDGLNGFLDNLATAAAFNGSVLFDGSYSQTCGGAPAVTNPDTLSSTLGVNTFDLPNMTDPQPYLDAIDAALASTNAQRASLQGWQTSIIGLLGYTP